jgi:K(+)-stimulated pyrophosphate-energized sodium pump
MNRDTVSILALTTLWTLVVAAIGGAILVGTGETLEYKLFLISLIGMGMLATVGVVVSMDTYGPVTDNAQGISEMSGDVGGPGAAALEELDGIGNTTKAITKGVAIATAVLAATSLFGAFAQRTGITTIGVNSPLVLAGLLVGGATAFLFSSLLIRAVGRAASQVVVEVRRQFRDHPGIMDNTERPDYARVVDICTRTSIRELLTPGLLAVLTPVIVGFFLKAEALGAYLAGAILTGQLMAVMLSTSGGAWDNAKKLVEEGRYGGKGSEPHKATVIGDTVGDPFKDTAGPALNPMIKVMNLVALLIAPRVVQYATNIGARAGIGLAAAAVLIAALWWSKSRRATELTSEGAPPQRVSAEA